MAPCSVGAGGSFFSTRDAEVGTLNEAVSDLAVRGRGETCCRVLSLALDCSSAALVCAGRVLSLNTWHIRHGRQTLKRELTRSWSFLSVRDEFVYLIGEVLFETFLGGTRVAAGFLLDEEEFEIMVYSTGAVVPRRGPVSA